MEIAKDLTYTGKTNGVLYNTDSENKSRKLRRVVRRLKHSITKTQDAKNGWRFF